jgi:drug/metabolite transporter (DMT)-like permease
VIIVYSKLLLMVILTSFSQILIKSGSAKIKTNMGFFVFLKTFFNAYIIIGLAMVLGAPFLYFSALSQVPLNLGFSINGLNYILVIILGHFVLKEKVSVFHITGALLILSGFIVWNQGVVLY